eukprot:CAMPEP_0184483954 /NCGR_PEP_ID=MMETSP0113_2-20130426/5642_1 /TAXON_ID=91329 /ORGANISM="Norrisiella sphaerica, Strain BC52" /LENGTH=1139 /DNA_ID=CAMNT_0026864653 /DNA_START=160 /DNA_END=3579 /DNA_ORIENTATION=+
MLVCSSRRGAISGAVIAVVVFLTTLFIRQSVKQSPSASFKDVRALARKYEYVEPDFELGEGFKHPREALDAHILNLDDKTTSQARNSFELQFNLSALEKHFHFRLKENVDIFSRNYNEYQFLGNGSINPKAGVEHKRRRKCLLRGVVHVEGHEKLGEAFFSACSDGINGMVLHEDVSFEMQYLKDEKKHIVVHMDDLDFGDKNKCGVHGTHGPTATIDKKQEETYPKSSTKRHEMLDLKNLHVHARKPREDENTKKSKVHTQGTHEGDIAYASSELYYEMLIVNDRKWHALRGKDTEEYSALVFSIMQHIIRGGTYGGKTYPGIQTMPEVNVRLAAQISLHEDPEELSYTETGLNCGDGCPSTGCAEIQSSCLLSSLKNWAQTPEFRDKFGFTATVALLTAHDFQGGTIGTAYVGSMCYSHSASVNQVRFSAVRDALLVAHETGHNLGGSHDSTGDFPSGTFSVMGPSLKTDATLWGATSTSGINSWTNGYGGSCAMSSDPGDQWSTFGICGDGIVDAGEECDPGLNLLASDTCCDSNCQLKSQCVCDPKLACCENDGSAFRVKGTICRQAQDSQCDYTETCTGTDALCPTDQFRHAGSDCGSNDGKCYKGRCVTGCKDADRPVFDKFLGDLCASGYQCCGGGSCRLYYNAPVQAGTPCAAESQCLASDEFGSSFTCELSSKIRFYRWECLNTGAVCTDEEGNEVAPANCEDAPPTCDATTPPSTTYIWVCVSGIATCQVETSGAPAAESMCVAADKPAYCPEYSWTCLNSIPTCTDQFGNPPPSDGPDPCPEYVPPCEEFIWVCNNGFAQCETLEGSVVTDAYCDQLEQPSYCPVYAWICDGVTAACVDQLDDPAPSESECDANSKPYCAVYQWTCEAGVALCVDQNNNAALSESDCTNTKPFCPVYSWTCEGGTAMCIDQNNKEASSESECNASEKPACTVFRWECSGGVAICVDQNSNFAPSVLECGADKPTCSDPNPNPPTSTPGLTERKYRGYFDDHISWFDRQTPIAPTPRVISDSIQYWWAGKRKEDVYFNDDNFSMTWTGIFNPPVPGATYYFMTESDDASYVYIDGFEIVRNQGRHAPRQKEGSLVLHGAAAIKIYYGDRKQGAAMNFYWKGGSQTTWTNWLRSNFETNA